MSAEQADRDRAWRLGALAAKAGRGLGGACPYSASDPAERGLAQVFVRSYIAAGGTVDGMEYGGGEPAEPEHDEFVFRGRTYRKVQR